jgi:hypothetical protein
MPVNASFAIRFWSNEADAVTVIRKEEKLSEGKTVGSLSKRNVHTKYSPIQEHRTQKGREGKRTAA